MRIAGCSTINNLQIWIGRSDWPTLISKAKRKHLGIFKVHDIQDKTSRKTATMVVSILGAKKRVWFKTGDNQ